MKFYRLSDATFYYHINTIYQFIKPFSDKKSLFFRNMELLITPLFSYEPSLQRQHLFPKMLLLKL